MSTVIYLIWPDFCDVVNHYWYFESKLGCQRLMVIVDVLYCYVILLIKFSVLQQMILLGRQRRPKLCGVDNMWDFLG